MTIPAIKPAHHHTSRDGFERMGEISSGALLNQYRQDPIALQRLRSAMSATNLYRVGRMSDHEVLAAAHVLLKSGHLKVKKDLCNKRDEKNRTYRDFIDAHRDDAAAIAAELQNTTQNILGLSALESTFGNSRFALEGKNFFGLHGDRKRPLPNQKSLIPAKGDPNVGMAVYESYLACAESFARTKGQLIVGINDPKKFATVLQKAGKFGIGPNGPIPSYVPDLVNVISNVGSRLSCK